MARKRRFGLNILSKMGTPGRPEMPGLGSSTSVFMGHNRGPLERPELEIGLEELYEVSKSCNAVRKSQQSLADFIFKNGLVWEKKFSRKCKNCGHEHPSDMNPERCDNCGHGPDEPLSGGGEHPSVSRFSERPNLGLRQRPPGPPPGPPGLGGGMNPGSGINSPRVPMPPQPGNAMMGAQGDQQPGLGAEEDSEEDEDRVEAEEPTVVAGRGEVPYPRAEQGNWYVEPDEKARRNAESFFDRVDRNGHSLIESLKIFEGHLNVADDAFLLAIQDLGIDPDGYITRVKSVKELFVPDPRNFLMVVDRNTMLPGGSYYICLKHRPKNPHAGVQDPWAETDRADGLDVAGVVQSEPGSCPICGRRLHDVWYVNTENGSLEDIIEYYVGPEEATDGSWWPGEVLHASKYHPSYGYGYSPVLSIYDMAKTLIYMEKYVRTFYEQERTPRAALFVPTRNPEGFEAVVKAAEDINVSQGGHYTPKFTYDPGEGGQMPQFLEFSHLPEEIGLTQQRDDYYKKIGSAFYVSPVLHGNTESAGLQNQGPSQWKVMTEGATLAQQVYDNKVFPNLLKLLGVDDWELRLAEVEEKDELQEVQVEMTKAQLAMTMMQLGFPPKERDENGDFVFPFKPDPNAGQMGQGGPGGVPGGLGGLLAGGGMPNAGGGGAPPGGLGGASPPTKNPFSGSGLGAVGPKKPQKPPLGEGEGPE